MKNFRERYLRLSLILITGIAFLNLTFFMAELSLISNAKNKPLIEQLQKLISSSVNEEEQDATPENGSSKEVEVDFFPFRTTSLRDFETVMDSRLKTAYIHLQVHPGFSRISTPPPDLSLV
jgi:hypothetical protein